MKRLAILIALFLLLPVSLIAAPSNPSPQRGGFNIYLTEERLDARHTSKEDIQDVRLGTIPILATDDVISYSEKTHEMKISESAFNRYRQNVHATFVVCVGKERIYGGAIWSNLLSSTYSGIVILEPLEVRITDSTLRIELGYPTEEYFEGQDNRSDPRIIEALKKAGKLIE